MDQVEALSTDARALSIRLNKVRVLRSLSIERKAERNERNPTQCQT